MHMIRDFLIHDSLFSSVFLSQIEIILFVLVTIQMNDNLVHISKTPTH